MQETITGLWRQHDADQDLIDELQGELKIDRDKIENLEIALVTARQIGTAVGVLTASRKITDEAAFELLRRASQKSHRKLRDIAGDVILTGTVDG